MRLESGDTFHAPERPEIGIPTHLWIIISDPCQDPENVLIVNLSSVKDGRPDDDSCILDEKDHPFIDHKSFIYYEKSKETSLQNLYAGVFTFGWSRDERVSDEVLKKIREGAIASPDMTNGRKKLLRRQGLV